MRVDDALERLAPAVVLPGHGAPFADVRGALERARARLDAFERDPAKNARHVLKVVFVFALLDRGAMPVAAVEGYVARVPCYRKLSERFLGLGPRELAESLVADLSKAGAVRIEDGVLKPAMPA